MSEYDEHASWLQSRGRVRRRPWPLRRTLYLRWLWTPFNRLHRRPHRGRLRYIQRGPRVYRWGRWHLMNTEHGTGGPYSADWLYWRRAFAGGRKPIETKVYCVEW